LEPTAYGLRLNPPGSQ